MNPDEKNPIATTMDEMVARLTRPYRPGDRVRAIETIIYVDDEIAEGTAGTVQQTNACGCTALVTVAWDGRGGPGQLPHVVHLCSKDSLEPERLS